MKFTSFIVASLAAVSTTNAELTACNMNVLFPIVTGIEAAHCAQDSLFSFAIATVTAKPPNQKQYEGLCKSSACYKVFRILNAVVPTDCALDNGSSLKEITNTISDSCSALVPPTVQQTPAAPPAPTPAPVFDGGISRCDNKGIVAFLNSADASECSNASGYNILMSAIEGKAPHRRSYDTLCSNAACKRVLKKISTLPSDCSIRDHGSPIKSLFDSLPATCK